MDSPATVTTSTISLVEYNNYLTCYDPLLEKFVELCNDHRNYTLNRGTPSAEKVKSTLKRIKWLLEDMRKSIIKAQLENKKNYHIQVAINKKDPNWWKKQKLNKNHYRNPNNKI